MTDKRSLVWDLESIFAGGSGSSALADMIDRTDRDIGQLAETISGLSRMDRKVELTDWQQVTDLLQRIIAQLHETDSFVGCLAAQNTADKQALILNGRIKGIGAKFESVLTRLDEWLVKFPDEAWSGWMEREPLKDLRFALEERRDLARKRMAPELESLAADLSVDGYHGWGQLYDVAVGKMEIPFEEQGETRMLSAGQAFNRLQSPDRTVRETMFAQWEEAWSDQAEFCAEALNHLGGFRLQLYKHRGWDSIHQEPLAVNRMQAATLSTMWDTINGNLNPFVEFLNRKAKIIGVDRLNWPDVDAPTPSKGRESHYTFDQAANLIVRQFRKFSPKMADFAEVAFEKRWIEAEDRSGKRPGGFCTAFPLNGSTRIFMTFGGTVDNVFTLAHELGHAFHQHVMEDLPILRQEYAMNVAETASTFAEQLVSDAIVSQASDKAEKIAFLENKVGSSVTFYMNIQARFVFENAFYKERKAGPVSADRLNELMLQAQQQTYKGALAGYHPHFWASKLHFYITEVPYYNFPYTFGYLFSTGIYDMAMRQGGSFEDRYISLLRDTGSMSVEALARKHLGVELTEPDFWQRAIDRTERDAREYLQLTGE